jgi:hypothetical protein
MSREPASAIHAQKDYQARGKPFCDKAARMGDGLDRARQDCLVVVPAGGI